MTKSSQKHGIPAWALILDVLGMLPLALGIYSLVSGELPFADGLEPGYLGIALIVFGVLLMGPLVVVLLKRSAGRR